MQISQLMIMSSQSHTTVVTIMLHQLVRILRVKAEIGWNISKSQNWTHIGDELWLNGTIYDGVYQTPILGDNISQFSVVLVTDDGRGIDLAQGVVDNQTSSFSANFTIPTNLPSNAYDIQLRFDFYTQQPEGGPYFASEEPIIDVSGSISSLPTPTVLTGVESEYVVQICLKWCYDH